VVTRRRLAQTHRRAGARLVGAVLAAALAALAGLAVTGTFVGRAAAEPRAVDARVVWARADRVYIAAPDSIALKTGDLIMLTRGKKTVASGEVTEVLARDLAAARITSGSLARITRLDRLNLVAESR